MKTYIVKVTQGEVDKAVKLRQFANFAPIQIDTLFDDTGIHAETLSEAVNKGAKPIQTIASNINAATVRFIDYMQNLEDVHKKNFNDKIIDLDRCKSGDKIWGELKFRFGDSN